MAIPTEGSGSTPVKQIPEFMVTAKNAATARLEKLKTDPNSIFEDIKYADSSLSKDDLQQALMAFSAETLKQYDAIYGDKDASGNTDGKVSVNEYIKAQTDIAVKNYEAMLKEMDMDAMSDAEIQIAKRTAELTAKNMDINEDGFISVEEEALINKTADSIDGNFDGTITATAADAVSTNVTGLDAENPEDPTNISYRYIMGESLTDEEKQKLEAYTSTIHDGIASTADTYGVDLSKNTVNVGDTTETPVEVKKVTIQKWGSKPANGEKYPNDCLSRIIANNYPEVKLYSKEYNEIVANIVEANGLKNANSIASGTELILP